MYIILLRSSGFIQPAFVEKMLLSSDADGFNDRQLIDFPPEREVYLRELKVPVPDTVPKLANIYAILQLVHNKHMEYTLEGDAYTAFEAGHDSLVDRKQAADDENIQGILSKAKGYMAQLAMILFALEQAIEYLGNLPHSTTFSAQAQSQLSRLPRPPSWSTLISVKAVEAAEKILTSLCNQKIIMLGKHQDAMDSLTSSDVRRLAKVLGTVASPEGIVRAYIISQKGIAQPTSNAQNLLNLAANFGFGDMQQTVATNNRATTVFRKRHYEELPEIAKNRLKKLKLTPQTYNNTFTS